MSWIIEKKDRVVAKIRDDDGNFIKSVIIPTVMYPLSSGEFRTFHTGNTKQITDEAVLAVIDSIPYKIGKCYTNAKTIQNALVAQGFDAVCYVGWLFIGENSFPIHHCWIVLNGESIIDLADDYTVMFSGSNLEIFNSLSLEEAREAAVDFQKAASSQKNSVRCFPVGLASQGFYYVGSECEADEGRRRYQQLIREFPDHECQADCDQRGFSRTQKLMKENGLMGG